MNHNTMNNIINPYGSFGFEINFFPVGEGERSGDAICMRWGYNLQGNHPDQFVMVVDGGFKENGDAIADHVLSYYGTDTVNLMVSTHPHSDHIGGLHVVMDRLSVRDLWIHQPWTHQGLANLFHDGRITNRSIRRRLIEGLESAYDLVKKAKQKQVCVREPFAECQSDCLCDVSISILGPSRLFYDSLLPGFAATPGSDDSFDGKRIEFIESWLVDRSLNPLDENGATSAENNSGVVLYLRLPDGFGGILLTGDAGIPALRNICDAASRLNIDFPRELHLLQLPHHGSIQNLTPGILDALFGPKSQVMPADGFQRIAFASVGKDSNCRHPSKHVINALCDRNVQCFETKGKFIFHWLGFVPGLAGYTPMTPLGPYAKVEETYVKQ